MDQLRTALPLVVWLLLAAPAARPADEKTRIADLVRNLGAGAFSVREQAAKELDKVGAPALPALREAVKDTDPERRKRAEALVRRIESRVTAAKLTAPKRIRLSFSDAPVARALADFKAQTGYDIGLVENTRLPDRTVTVDTGEVTFWQAMDRFCRAAGLTEEPLPPDRLKGLAIAGGGAPPRGSRPAPTFTSRGRVVLANGKWPVLPTDDTTAFRVRCLGRADAPAGSAAGEVVLRLEVAPEPPIRCQATDAVEVRTPSGDRGRSMESVFPVVGQGSAHVVPVRLAVGAKPPAVLTELSGTLTLRVLGDPEPLVTVDQITEAGGKTVRAAAGLAVRVVDVEQPTPGQFRVQFEVDPPEGARFSGSWRDGRLRLGFGPGALADYEMVLVNNRGEVLTQGTWGMKGAGGVIRYTLGCPTTANPAKLVCFVRKSITLDVPFCLRDIPLRGKKGVGSVL